MEVEQKTCYNQEKERQVIMWEGGKGDKRRPAFISTSEADLRWELFSSKTTQERKDEIIKLLEELKQCTQTPLNS